MCPCPPHTVQLYVVLVLVAMLCRPVQYGILRTADTSVQPEYAVRSATLYLNLTQYHTKIPWYAEYLQRGKPLLNHSAYVVVGVVVVV